MWCSLRGILNVALAYFPVDVRGAFERGFEHEKQPMLEAHILVMHRVSEVNQLVDIDHLLTA